MCAESGRRDPPWRAQEHPGQRIPPDPTPALAVVPRERDASVTYVACTYSDRICPTRADVRGIGMPRLPVAYAWREEGCARAGGAGAIAPAVCAGVRAMWAPQIFNCFSLASFRQSRRDSW